MSHHLSAAPGNPTGAVEIVRVDSAEATTAPPDTGGGGGVTPVQPAGTGATGASGTPGANLPVDSVQQAGNVIESGKADLAATAGAERRLDGFDGVGGGGGGGGDLGGDKHAGDGADGLVNEDNELGAVAAGTADLNVSDQQGGLASQLVQGEQVLDTTGLPDQDPRSIATE